LILFQPFINFTFEKKNRTMKKIFIFFLLTLIFCGPGFGKQVDELTAKSVARNFLAGNISSGTLQSSPKLNLVYRATSTTDAMEPVTCFYVFNFDAGQGFVIVSGDDKASPVLGYSVDRSFNVADIPPHVASWLEYYQREILYAIENDIEVPDQVQATWHDLVNGVHGDKSGNTSVVAPLLQTTWDQSPNYNAQCPYDNQYQEYTVTGCVATAMAQVMKYWNSPVTGAGYHSYNTNRFGTLSADFGSTTYQWASMPSSLNGPNSAVATLMYQCGVSVDMNYGVGQTGGSSAYVVSSQSPTQNCSEYAFKTYFGFKPTLVGQMRDDYSLANWITKLKTDLDASRPVLYAGIGDGGGHCFVCDGYDASSNFHFNWGWSGQYDGYFAIDALNPQGVGTGGGTGGFNSYQQAIFGVEPIAGGGGGGGGTTNDLRLYSAVGVSASSIYYGGSFDITASVGNFGTGNFQGDFCAAIFDSQDIFIGMVDSIMNQTLESGFYFDLTFSNTGLLAMTPGTYAIGIYYRPNGDNWYLVQNGTYSNYIQITVTNPNTIELYAPMNITPGTTLISGQPIAVHLDVVNNGNTSFTGTFDVSLYNLDGDAVFTVAQFTNETLPSGYHYTNGLDFNNNNLGLAPGTYLAAIQYKPDGGNWELTGSTNYQNPVRVTVQQEALTADMFEPNNTVAESYTLPVNFSGSEAIINTTGSNCHTGNDYDLYKIVLPQGYSYTVGGKLFDANFGNNGQTYTLDAIFMYSTDGVNGSDVYDDMIPSSISLANGGTVWFQVSPKYTGQTGTYLLRINVGKYPQGINPVAGAENIRVFPNPASGAFTVDLGAYPGSVSQIDLVNMQGQTVQSAKPASSQDNMRFETGELPEGLYMLNMILDKGQVSKRIVIRR
jgi:hypothetical protein